MCITDKNCLENESDYIAADELLRELWSTDDSRVDRLAEMIAEYEDQGGPQDINLEDYSVDPWEFEDVQDVIDD